MIMSLDGLCGNSNAFRILAIIDQFMVMSILYKDFSKFLKTHGILYGITRSPYKVVLEEKKSHNGIDLIP